MLWHPLGCFLLPLWRSGWREMLQRLPQVRQILPLHLMWGEVLPALPAPGHRARPGSDRRDMPRYGRQSIHLSGARLCRSAFRGTRHYPRHSSSRAVDPNSMAAPNCPGEVRMGLLCCKLPSRSISRPIKCNLCQAHFRSLRGSRPGGLFGPKFRDCPSALCAWRQQASRRPRQ